MSIIDAILLGIIQGFTEFFPISSSGHLKLAQYFLNLRNLSHYLLFDLICHLGTLCAIFLVLRRKILEMIFQQPRKLLLIGVGLLPLFPLLLLMKPIKSLFNETSYLGFFFLITAVILFIGVKFGKTLPEPTLRKKEWRDAFKIGIAQAFAILPGVSRSGTTISTARVLGWSQEQAVTFSFLLAIPTILGGTIIESLAIWRNGGGAYSDLSWLVYFAGFATSLFCGYVALKWVIRLAGQNKFMYFVWYCAILGLAVSLYFHFF